MHYLVDAYNLLFRRLGWHDDLRAQREKMVERLNEKVDLTGWEVTLVFDAIHQYGDATRSRHDALDIIFTGEGVTADDHIVDIVKRASHPRSLIVVSSDKRLCWEARNYGADTLSVEEFEAKLNKRYRKKKWDLDHKTLPEAKKPPEPEALPEPRRRVPRPTDAQTPGLCYDWYLQEFEERLETKDD